MSVRVAGPLGWLIPSEICPLEVRSTGQSLNVAVNFLFSFVIGQAFLSMLCVFQYGIFFFFAGWVAAAFRLPPCEWFRYSWPCS